MQRGGAPRESGKPESAVRRAEDGFSARLDEGGEGDCEFADAEPADAAGEV